MCIRDRKQEARLTKDAMLQYAAGLGVYWRRELRNHLLPLPYKDSKNKTGLNSWAVQFGVLTVVDKAPRDKPLMVKEIIEEVARLMAQTSDASTRADPAHHHDRGGTDGSDGDGDASGTGPEQGGSTRGSQPSRSASSKSQDAATKQLGWFVGASQATHNAGSPRDVQ